MYNLAGEKQGLSFVLAEQIIQLSAPHLLAEGLKVCCFGRKASCSTVFPEGPDPVCERAGTEYLDSGLRSEQGLKLLSLTKKPAFCQKVLGHDLRYSCDSRAGMLMFTTLN